jgi:hypothetical protein
MGNVTKSQPYNIISPNGNSLAVFVNGESGQLMLKDVQGNVEPISNYIPLNPITMTPAYGSFYDTTTQTALGNDTPTPIKYNMTDFSVGVSIQNNSEITVVESGYYNIQFSAQLDRVSGSGLAFIDIWLRVNGQDVPYSNTKVTMTGNANQSKIVAAWNFLVNLTAGSYAELMWNTPTTNIKIVAEPANLVIPYPEIPSVILTVIKI